MNSLKVHQQTNRARRLARRAREVRATILSLDQRVAAIEDQEDVPDATKALQIARLRDRTGPLNAQLHALQARVSDTVAPRVWTPRVPSIPIPTLPRTDSFPAADLGRRIGKCVRAFFTVSCAH